jgi:RNA polymerase sigma-70 factor (ECF subfamily)
VDERQLLDRIAAGDSDAIDTFVRRHERDVRQFVRGAGVPAADVPDVCQEVLLDAVRQLSIGRFEGRASIRTWLWQIARGKSATYRRSRRRALDRAASIEFDSASSPDFMAHADQELRLHVAAALAELSPRHRIALVAHVRGEVSVQDLCRLFGLTEKRVRNLIAEAKRQFREQICGRGNVERRRRLTGKGDDRS